MSWSFSVIGKPAAVCDELDRHAETCGMTGQSKLEFEEAREHLKALVKQNFATGIYLEPILHLEARGSGSVDSNTGAQLQRSCTVELKLFYTKLV